MYSPDSQECGFLARISLNRNSRSPKLVVTTILAVAEKASVGSMRNVSPIKVASSITVLLPVGVEATFPVATSLQTNFGLPFFVVVVGISVMASLPLFPTFWNSIFSIVTSSGTGATFLNVKVTLVNVW